MVRTADKVQLRQDVQQTGLNESSVCFSANGRKVVSNI